MEKKKQRKQWWSGKKWKMWKAVGRCNEFHKSVLRRRGRGHRERICLRGLQRRRGCTIEGWVGVGIPSLEGFPRNDLLLCMFHLLCNLVAGCWSAGT